MLKISKKIKYTLLSVVALMPMYLFAHGGGPDPDPTIPNPIKSDTIGQLLTTLLDIIVRIGTPLIIMAFIYSGFKFIKAQGNATELEDAKKTALYTAIGAAVLLGAEVLGRLIEGTIDLI